MSEHEPHVPENPPKPGEQPGEPGAVPSAPPPAGEPPASPPPGSPLASPPGTPPPPAAASPGPMHPAQYPPAGYPQPGGYPTYPAAGYPQAPGYPAQQHGYPPAPGYPQHGYPPAPGYPQHGYPAQPYAAGPVAPPRPPLAPRQRRGAMLAGAVAFALMSLGFSLIAIPLAITAFGAFFGTLFSWIARNNPDDLSVNGFPGRGDLQQIIADAWSTYAPWLIGLSILGLILWILGYLSSLWILRSHSVNRPGAVTWSGLGIAIVCSFLLSALASPLSGLSGMFTPNLNGPEDFDGPPDLDVLGAFDFTPLLVFGVVALLLGTVVNAAIGLLSWWWMAHAFRAHAAAPLPAP